jgi:hypothetical protein
VAVVSGNQIVLRRAADLSQEATYPASGADAVAISKGWLAWRERSGSRDAIRARSIANPDSPGPVRTIATAKGAKQLSQPSVAGRRLVYGKAVPRRNRILFRALGAKRRRVLVSSVTHGLSNPTVHGKRLLYVRHERGRDRLKLASLRKGKRKAVRRGAGRTLLRSKGTLWSTAMTGKRAYVTVIKGTRPKQRIISVKR